jgi:hypothetical protein
MEMPSNTTTLSGIQSTKRTLLKHSLYLLSALSLAVPLPSLAAMVYGNVAGCSGEIRVQGGSADTRVPIQNGAYQVVLPPGTYSATCISNGKRQGIVSSPSSVRQNLNF